MSDKTTLDRAIDAIAGYEVDYMVISKREAADIVERIEAARLRIVDADSSAGTAAMFSALYAGRLSR